MSTSLLFLAPVLVTLALKVNSLVGIKQAPSDLALVAEIGALVAMVGNPFFGRMSDRTVTAVIGLALGALLRRTAAGLSVFAAVFLVVPLVAAYLPQSIKGFAPYLPSNAGGTVWGAGKLFGGHQLGPWTGFAVLCAYAAVLTAAAAWRLRRRDA
ncbi:MAG TPA: hypothetical protein VGS06_07080 [Streptosporangiaceae bacterium]|nr:hypothetical protein [Streptosporangiaceae bacterium]